MILPVKGKGSM